MITEQVHRYPRWITWLLELMSLAIVALALLRFSRMLLITAWKMFGLDTGLFPHVPYLARFVQYLSEGVPFPRSAALGLNWNGLLSVLPLMLPALLWLLLALVVAILLRNSLPTIRTSPRGMLVEFAGDWLPIPWEMLRAIKVTEDLAAERFVLLAETDHKQLTMWHRFYSLIYRLSFRRSFLIISAISDFQILIKTLLSETDRVARVLDNVKPAKLQEEASSPFFRLVLSPGSFFSRRTQAENTDQQSSFELTNILPGHYPRRISMLLTWVAAVLALVVLVRYAIYWLTFLAIIVPLLRNLPVFNQLQLVQLPAPWWLLVAAHLLVIILFWFLAGLRNLLPDLEARGDGLAVRHFGRWILLPWSTITSIKVTELSEASQIILIQTPSRLPASSRLSSLIYDGSFAPGVLVTSALTNFEQMLQRIVLEVTRYAPTSSNAGSPILQSSARSSLLALSFRAGPTLDQIVEEIREEPESTQIDTHRLIKAGWPMLWLAAPPALLLFFDRAIQQGILPNGTMLGGMIVLFVLGIIEWPVVSLVLATIDEMSGGGEEGQRAFYLYPTIQLPRLLPLAAALVFVLLGVPFAPVLLWLGAIGWSFLLAAGMSEALYDWRGGQLIAGGMVPVVFQLFILLAYLLVIR